MGRMNYWKARLNAVWCEMYEESAEEVFDAIEMMKLIDKQYRKSKYMKKKEGL